MSEWDYSWDYGGEQPYDDWSYYPGGSSTFDESGGYSEPIGPGLGWDASSYPTGGGGIIDPLTGNPIQSGGGGGIFNSILGGLGSVGSFLGNNASWLGPLASAGGSLASGALGAQASDEAARLQAAALNRGIDLQTAQWLQQQANQAPWLQAGQQALPQLQQLAGQGPQAPFQPGASIDPRAYGMPDATPRWTPQGYQGPAGVDPNAYRYTPGQGPRAGDYRYTPGQGPSAAAYRYTPGQTPDATAYQSGPPQLYQGAMPGTQVPTLQGQELLAQDPGYQFRQDQARKALEASALAQGAGLSGGTLSALQRQSQDLASQEYGNAWQRMMARNTEQYGRDWGQYQQRWNQGVQGTQLGLQTQAQNFGQAMSAAQLREQVNQVAMQQGWSQAQAEAAFREQLAQQASQQGFTQSQAEAAFREQLAQQASQQGFAQALAGQGQQYQQGLQSAQYLQAQQQKAADDYYNRVMGQRQLLLGEDVARNQTDYDRQLAAYNSMQQNQTTQWNRLAGLAGVGQTAVGQLGEQGAYAQRNLSSLLSQLGTAQGGGELGGALSWQRALGGATNNLTSILAGLNR